jgi:hypothetical protein
MPALAPFVLPEETQRRMLSEHHASAQAVAFHEPAAVSALGGMLLGRGTPWAALDQALMWPATDSAVNVAGVRATPWNPMGMAGALSGRLQGSMMRSISQRASNDAASTASPWDDRRAAAASAVSSPVNSSDVSALSTLSTLKVRLCWGRRACHPGPGCGRSPRVDTCLGGCHADSPALF